MPEEVVHGSQVIRSRRPRGRGLSPGTGAPGPRLLAVAVALSLLAPLGGTACAREEAGGPESARIARVMELAPGMVVADVGAGDGAWTVGLARRVGPGGRVYATEVTESLLEEIRERAEEEGLANVTVLLGDQEGTGLAAGCCDAILLRKVYHHFTDPAAMNESLYAALKPGGRLAVIEYRDFLSYRVQGVPESRSGHGLDPEILTLELEAAGFELERVIEEWPGEANEYCALYRRPSPPRPAASEAVLDPRIVALPLSSLMLLR